MDDLPARFTALVARKPELAVENLYCHADSIWFWHAPGLEGERRILPDAAATALITCRLIEKLPPFTGPRRGDYGWFVEGEKATPTLIEAVLTFHENQP